MELLLLVVPNVFDPPNKSFDFATLAVQILRTSCFIILPSLYFGLRNDNKLYEDSDVERQSLLQKKLGKKPLSEASTLNGNGYGTTTENSQDSDTADNSSDASEDSWLASQRKAQAKIDKRLEQDGNWFTYAKGFTVSLSRVPTTCALLTLPRFSSPTSGLITTESFNSEPFLCVSAF